MSGVKICKIIQNMHFVRKLLFLLHIAIIVYFIKGEGCVNESGHVFLKKE